MSRLHVVHTTTFSYDGAVTASYNEARLTPPSEQRQRVLEATVDVAPHSWRHQYRDYWGTAVSVFESAVPHDRLVITATARVDVLPVPQPSPQGWSALRVDAVRDPFAEFLAETPRTTVPADVVALAEDAAATREPDEAARETCDRLRSAVEYVPGATAVHSGAADAWRARKGVCQDMAHLSVGALRSIGIPARYVSGYLHPVHGGGEVGQVVTGESHAWVEWWAGEWIAYDPTNGIEVADRHVVLARGREYQDVAPVRGIYAGARTDALVVNVQITREA